MKPFFKRTLEISLGTLMLMAGSISLPQSLIGQQVLATIPGPINSAGGPVGIAVGGGFLYVTRTMLTEIDRVDGSGNVVAWATLPKVAVEPYIAIAPSGANTFPAGNVYVIVPFSVGATLYEFTPAGGAPTRSWNVPFTPPVSVGDHSGIAFDEQGAFGRKMLLTFSDASAWTFDGTTFTKIGTFPTMSNGMNTTEGPRVAPNTFTPGGIPAGGQLIATLEDINSIYRMNGTGSVNLVTNSIIEPEALQFIPTQTCPLSATAAAGTAGAGVFFVTGITNNKIYSFPASMFNSLTGAVVVTEVMPPTFTGTLERIDDNATQQAQLWPGELGIALEGSAFVDCFVPPPTPTRGCTLTQGAYKNKFNSKVFGVVPDPSIKLGNVLYTDAQLNAILQNNSVKGNGLLSLAHQLVTAKLNIYYGASAPPAVQTAIAQADALIGNLVVPPVGNGFLAASLTSAVESVLDNFNNGLLGTPHCP